MGWSAMRASTSASQARGSVSFIFVVTISEYIAANLSPPRSEPASSQAFLPSAMLRSARSAALFVWKMGPSPRNLLNASQRFCPSSNDLRPIGGLW